jgi:hypothetical protein
MRPPDPHSELGRLFSELRRADEASAPPFRRLLERARAARGAPSRPRLLPFAALSVVIAAAALAVVLYRRPALQTASRERPVAVSQWRSPTDWLLQTPGSELLSELPELPAPFPTYTGFQGAGEVRAQTPTAGR